MPTDIPLFNLSGARVTVMGLGRFGGGVGAVRFLADRGARVTLTDLLPEQELADSLAQLDGVPLEAVHLGGHDEIDFLRPDFVVASPAVRCDNRYLQLARTAGVPVTSEMNLFWMHNRGRVIGVTGSNGKSTTAALVHAMLAASGRTCWLGGNIGRSLLPVVDEIQPDDWVVLELSSFQLHGLDDLFSSPEIAVITNFSPNHLDWHGTLEEYRHSKQCILRWQHAGQTAVLNADDRDLIRWTCNGRRVWFGLSDTDSHGAFQNGCGAVVRDGGGECHVPLHHAAQLPGEHNLQNVLAAIAAARSAGVEIDAIERAAGEFRPLPHRLELVATVDGRRFYNDSLATTGESAIAALESFDAPIVLLAGGYDKGVDLRPFATAMARRCKAVALMGQTAETLSLLIDQETFAHAPPHRECDSLGEAFGWALENSESGDVVLLSPGCASYDWFANFADRGERFRQLVREFEAQRNQSVSL